MSAQASPSSGHPSPHRDRVSVWLLLTGLAAGPTGWALQLIANYGLSSLACFPHDTPSQTTPPPGWDHEFDLLLTINLVCLAIALAGFLISWAHWRRTRGEKVGGAGRLVDVGEGRTRFLSACGMLAGAGFIIAILFDTAVVIGAPACWSIAP